MAQAKKKKASKKPKGRSGLRLKIEFSREATKSLEKIRSLVRGDQSNAAVLRSALRIFYWLLDKREKGSKFQLVEGDVVKEVEFKFF